MNPYYRPRRSMLYVPGCNPRYLNKARTLKVDSVILDLGDPILVEMKEASRRYVVTVRGRVSPDTAKTLESGIDAEGADGRRERLAAASIAILKASHRETHLIVELLEGRNREVRRLFASAGHEVTRLHRIAFGPYELGDLEPGQWREVQVESNCLDCQAEGASDQGCW